MTTFEINNDILIAMRHYISNIGLALSVILINLMCSMFLLCWCMSKKEQELNKKIFIWSIFSFNVLFFITARSVFNEIM